MLAKIASQVAALSVIAGTASAAVTFTAIGVPPAGDPQTPPFSEGYGVSDDGTVVGSQFVPGAGFLSFRWTAGGGRQTINGLFPDSGIFARSITPDGRVIVGENTGPSVAFRQVNGGAIESLGLSDPDFYDGSSGSDVSNDGRVISGVLSRISDGTLRAARWEEGAGWQDLGVLSGDIESSANAISGDGSVVAGYSVGNFFTAVKWTSTGGLEALPSPFGITGNSAVIAMAADGSSFVGQANNQFGLSQAVVWGSNGSTRVLDNVPGFDSGAAFGVSADGSIIGGTAYIENVGADIAAFWTSDGTAYDLKAYLASNGINLPGWTLTAVTEVSQNGLYMTGRGINPDGNLEGFFVQIPSPGSAVSMMLGVVFAGRRRR